VVSRVEVRALGPEDRQWADASLRKAWGSVFVARKDELLDASALPGFVAVFDGSPVGLATNSVEEDAYEIVSIHTELPGHGVGRALMSACVDEARERGCRRVWLITTNDNVRAIAFYQRFGMDLCALHRNAVERARRLKDSIPFHDAHGVPIRHELEFEFIVG
jgi:ribosomal protein S18 acetylase RimI-like enzyme